MPPIAPSSHPIEASHHEPWKPVAPRVPAPLDLALTAAGLPLWAAAKSSPLRKDKPTNKETDIIKVGIIGIGSNGKGSKGSQMQSRARQLVGDVRALKRDNIKFTAICDVDTRHLTEGAEMMKSIGHEVKTLQGLPRTQRRKDVDVVSSPP